MDVLRGSLAESKKPRKSAAKKPKRIANLQCGTITA